MALDYRLLAGGDLASAIDDVAALRIAVFAEWPYLYDGDMNYERNYLAPYLSSDAATVVGAFDGDRLVGASTALPLTKHSDDFSAAFAGTDFDLSDLYYCAESVLLPEYRRQGAGHRFFDARERRARSLGFSRSCFCAVTRPETHPARPAHYRPLDDFWRARGYSPVPGAVAYFSWKDAGEPEETEKPLQFWIRSL
ncbi:GNAT family N-acetyltransferase [uncultured Roseobacter sp.]|uniref:GNAT family N-acetyltransferase n=1 Tax=uncultured Roseobacter sp. TaxID=114847 RepID=UPI002626942F|nr:GNAT family N-acetyltransferase [uncultured Roseobacter sp.]